MLKQAENKVTIEGILSEVNIQTGESKKDGKPYISGEVKVKVRQDINGIAQDIEVPVNFYSTKTTKKGTPNPAYDSINKFLTDYTSVAACGDEAKATRIRIDSAEIGENEFYGQNGNLVSFPRIRASFAKAIKKEDCKEQAGFTAVIVVGDIKDEVDKDGSPTGRLVVKGILIQYAEKADVVNFVVASNEAINHIRSYWNTGDTVRIAGKVDFSSKTEVITENVGFGEPIESRKTISTRELVITSGSPSGLDGDLAYEAADIKEALKARQVRLEAQKDEASNKKAAPAEKETATTDFGF